MMRSKNLSFFNTVPASVSLVAIVTVVSSALWPGCVMLTASVRVLVAVGLRVTLSARIVSSSLQPRTGAHNKLARIKDRPKVVGEGDDAVEVRRLSPEEKARRRAVRNVILFIVGVAILLAYVVYQSRR